MAKIIWSRRGYLRIYEDIEVQDDKKYISNKDIRRIKRPPHHD